MTNWESLEIEALENSIYSESGIGKCKFSKFLDTLDSEARSHVQSALINHKISGRALYKALRARGMDCKHTVFREHRAFKCICFEKKD